jgi:HTH-type transcriptional regulator/antitoxin HigA
MNKSNFQPNWLSAPGATILDILDEREMSAKELATLLGYTLRRAERLLAGKEAITKDVAKLLSGHLGGSERFWMSREGNYRSEVARLQSIGNQSAAKAWLDELPIRDMQKFGWIPRNETVGANVEACLHFFDVANVSEWRAKYQNVLSAVSFRTSPTYKSEPGAVLAWLRYGEVRARQSACRTWDAAGFNQSLLSIRRLTRHKGPSAFLPQLKALCAENGVALVISRAPAGCAASGATRFINEHKAMILLSFRYMSDDQFWFTFFHEAAHLILHGTKALFLEDGSEVCQKEEHEANLFAQNILVPPSARAEFINLKADKLEIIRFAVKIGVSRGIVLGQLQHQGRVRPEQLNWLKRRYRLDDLLSAIP